MNKTFLSGLLLFFTLWGFGQRYMTKNGHINFYSETPLETIEAHNNQVNCALDISSGDFVFRVLMKSFAFKKALMQEHFNENYVESDRFPNAMFKGKIIDIGNYDFISNGLFVVQVEGDLSIHGVSRPFSTNGTFTIKEELVEGVADFTLKPEDFNIHIPNTVLNKIADEMEVTVKVSLKEFKK